MTLEQILITIDSLTARFKPYLLRLWEHRKYFLIFNFLSLVIVLLWLIVLYKPSFESEIVILPEFNSSPVQTGGSLLQLSNMLGLSGGGASTEMYENLIKSEPILANVIYSRYYSYELHDTIDLPILFKMKSNPKLPQRQQTRDIFLRSMKIVKKSITTDLDIATKILTIKVQMPESQLSADVANNIILSLDYYLNTKRKSIASNQLFYIEKRMLQVKDSLNLMEERFKVFRTENISIDRSPDLLLKQNRLLRTIEILQTIYVELTKQFEIIKLDEIRETPVLNVREIAKDPVEKANPYRRLKFCVAMFLSLAISSMYFIFMPEIKIVTRRLKDSYQKAR
jgi:uncharacterized protein involved in exopolysaccharide biosynthesis